MKKSRSAMSFKEYHGTRGVLVRHNNIIKIQILTSKQYLQ